MRHHPYPGIVSSFRGKENQQMMEKKTEPSEILSQVQMQFRFWQEDLRETWGEFHTQEGQTLLRDNLPGHYLY